ncbi:hypothetical protein PRK78_002261 [Emydomyces testavorans]|uniref:Uncharacterized protein n=1 Tax=Emydomyces testavorans TaxID=2070801 RepID=A0AAF0DDT5_9EURO|nr:hypothetical protein PRK78_002261 [Emydomyces testavorans]
MPEARGTSSNLQRTVEKIFSMLLQHRVAQVRGTPTSGKTTLAELLYTHIANLSKNPLQPVFITWQLPENPQVGYDNHLRVLSSGRTGPDLLIQNDLVLIIDEAQLSYNHIDFWMTFVKRQVGNGVGPYIILFSSYGSADSTVMSILGSAPVTLEHFQRVSLTPQPDSPHKLSLCFNDEEFDDLCLRFTNGGEFTISDMVRDYIFQLTNGHPGLCHGLLQSMLDLAVCISSGILSMSHADGHRSVEQFLVLVDALQ